MDTARLETALNKVWENSEVYDNYNKVISYLESRFTIEELNDFGETLNEYVMKVVDVSVQELRNEGLLI